MSHLKLDEFSRSIIRHHLKKLTGPNTMHQWINIFGKSDY